MAFWCAVVKAGDSKAEDLAENDVVLSVGNIALNNGVEGKPCKLWAAIEDEDGPQKVLLATLRTPHAEQAVLDITFPQDVTFSVEGSGEIHMSGVIAPADDGEDDEAMYGGFPSDEDMESGEEGSGDGEDEELDSEDMNDPRVEELGSDASSEEPVAKPAAKPAKLLTRKPEAPAADAGAAKKQKVDIPITTGKKAAADAKPKAGAKPAAEGVVSLTCTLCPKTFNAPAGLDQHMKAKHGAGGDAKPAAAEKPATPKASAPAKPSTPKGAPKPAAAGTPKAATPKGAKK